MTKETAESHRARPKIVVVAGPTGSGKTGLGVELGKRFDGEVINADSRYLYRGFDIGTAKPTLSERKGVPHHLIDVLAPDDDFSLARYQELAYRTIDDVVQRGRLPLLVGGTPLYIKAVVEGWRIPRVPPDPEIRARLETECAEHGVERLIERLTAVDPASAERCGVNPRRIIRALEIYEITGVPMSELEGKGPRPYDTLELGLWRDRGALYTAIDQRIDRQIDDGLVGEVEQLLASGVPATAPAFSSIGYRQLLPAIAGKNRWPRESRGSDTIRTGMCAIRKPGCAPIRGSFASMSIRLAGSTLRREGSGISGRS
ncbi:MAG: tRNA (adenosine(37)-N6)-dimethylallyltransferase MiaA [Thermomicrobiales bacterium]